MATENDSIRQEQVRKILAEHPASGLLGRDSPRELLKRLVRQAELDGIGAEAMQNKLVVEALEARESMELIFAADKARCELGLYSRPGGKDGDR